MPGAVAAEQQGIRLVDDEHGLLVFGFLEGLPDVLFAFTHPFALEVAQALADDLSVDAVGQVARQGALPGPGRSIEEQVQVDPFVGVKSQTLFETVQLTDELDDIPFDVETLQRVVFKDDLSARGSDKTL